MGLLKLFEPLVKAGGSEAKMELPARDMKSWTVDPLAFMESVTHRERPSSLSYEQLRQMAYRCDVVSAILQTRINQVASFCAPQPDRHSYGYGIVQRDRKASGSKGSDKMVAEISQFIQSGGLPGAGRDNFEAFLKKFTRDSLVFDQACFEIIPRNNGLPAFFEAVDASSIRLATEPPQPTDDKGFKKTDGAPEGQTIFQQAVTEWQQKMLTVQEQGGEQVPAKYVQLVDGTVKATYSANELYFGIRNPRTDLMVAGYGMSELETLISVITSYLWAEEYNRKIFSQGSIPKGILNLKGEISDTQMAAFRREWTNLVAGVQNSWKTPLINAEDIDYINLQSSNKDMEYMQWIQFLVRIACAVYLIDPAEINFDMPRGLDAGNAMIETSGEAKLRASKDRGLQPLLRFIARGINEGIVWKLDPDFEFRFLGLDAKTSDQELQQAVQSVSSYKTLNEVRAENDLEPVEMGDTVLNPIYVQLLQGEQEQEQQEQLMKLAQKNPEAALIMQGVNPKEGEAKADSIRQEGEAKADAHRMKGEAQADAHREQGKAKAAQIRKGEKKGKGSNKSPASKRKQVKKKAVKKALTSPFSSVYRDLLLK